MTHCRTSFPSMVLQLLPLPLHSLHLLLQRNEVLAQPIDSVLKSLFLLPSVSTLSPYPSSMFVHVRRCLPSKARSRPYTLGVHSSRQHRRQGCYRRRSRRACVVECTLAILSMKTIALAAVLQIPPKPLLRLLWQTCRPPSQHASSSAFSHPFWPALFPGRRLLWLCPSFRSFHAPPIPHTRSLQPVAYSSIREPSPKAPKRTHSRTMQNPTPDPKIKPKETDSPPTKSTNRFPSRQRRRSSTSTSTRHSSGGGGSDGLEPAR